MLFAYLDEFGHNGPFVSRIGPRYNESPAFGLAGLVLPGHMVRPFSTKFLQLKEHSFAADIAKSRKKPQIWEKKGVDIFRPRAIEKYPELREAGFRLLSYIHSVGGSVFYHGREKNVGRVDGNPNGLYTTVLARAIRRLDALAAARGENFVIVLDEHSARKELLECAQKTMFGSRPARRLVSPPFEVESYLDQNIQAADWISAIVGRLAAHELQPVEYADHAIFRSYYWDRVQRVAQNSSVMRVRAQAENLAQPDPVAPA